MYKFLIQIMLLLMIIPYQAISQKGNYSEDRFSNEMYLVKRIKKINNIYVIYASKDGKQFKIISPKGSKQNGSCKIKKGREYHFILSPYFNEDDFSRFSVSYVEINGTYIQIEEAYNNNLYLTTSLVGLYYKKP